MTNYRALAVIPAVVGLLAAITVVYILWQRKQRNSQYQLTLPSHAVQRPNRLVWGLSPEEERTEEEDLHPKPPLHESAILQGTTEDATIGLPTPGHHRHPERQPLTNHPTKTSQQRKAVTSIREALPLKITPNHKQTTRVRKFVFLSQARDSDIYPNANLYRVQLPRVLRNVIAVALQVGVIPKSEYNVNPYSQWLDIDEGGTIYQVQMPVGHYSLLAATSFVTNLEAAINAVPALAAYTVTYDVITRKLTIDSNGAAFIMLFGSGPNRDNSLWQQMGFPRTDTTNAVSHVAPGVIDLNGATAIDLYVDELTPILEGSLAHIDLFPSDYTNYNPLDSGVRRYFWPIGKMGYLTFRFTTGYTVFNADDGIVEEERLYDFNGREHSLRLEFVYREYRNVLEDEIELDPPI